MNVIYLGLISIMLSIAGYAYGEGGKVKNPHYIVDENGCGVFVGNTTNCEEVPASPQSGIQQYICEVPVVCLPDEDEEDEELDQSKDK